MMMNDLDLSDIDERFNNYEQALEAGLLRVVKLIKK